MADPNYILVDGFDHYYPVTDNTIEQYGWNPNFASAWPRNNAGLQAFFVAATVGSGAQLRLSTAGASAYYTGKNLPSSYARILGGVTLTVTPASGNNKAGVFFLDAFSNVQLAIALNATTNKIEVYRGNFATLLATSTESISSGSANCIEWDVTFSQTVGIVKVYLNGALTSINLTGQDTCATANAYCDGIGPMIHNLVGSTTADFDHLYVYCYTSAGGSETPLLTNPVVYTTSPTSDDTSDFVPLATILGAPVTTTTSASGNMGANLLYLRPFTPPVNMTLNSLGGVTPTFTSATPKIKPVLYADSSGVPGAFIGTGSESVGTTNGTPLTLPFTSTHALTGGTTYWLGFMCDTSIPFRRYDTTTSQGQSKTSTYTSGPPSPAGGSFVSNMTLHMYGNCTNAASNYPAADDLYASLGNQIVSATVGDQDYFGFNTLPTTPSAIYAVSIAVNLSKSDGGARTAKINVKSGATESSGSLGTFNPALTQAYYTSYWINDPNTGASWTVSGLNAAKGGYEIAS